MLMLKIKGIPKPKQSFKFKKNMHKYPIPEAEKESDNIRSQIISQLPADFKIFDGFIFMSIFFIFPLPSILNKKDRQWTQSGTTNNIRLLMKNKKPDIENLLKLLNDAMEGIVFINDSRVCCFKDIVKAYGTEPSIIILIKNYNAKSLKIDLNLEKKCLYFF